MKRVFWFLKQLFPVTYRSHYSSNGSKRFAVWKMWFGRCYNAEDHAIAE